jgi:DNA-binding transcriptional ArsR family regulator
MDRSDERAVKIFKALSNTYRFQIMKQLLNESKNVSKLAEELRVTSETVSKHLRVLRNCELVSDQREGNNVIYSVNRPEVVQKLFDILPDLHRDEDDNPDT